MSITHHSNYIRWMEEARIDYLMKAGCDYRFLEEEDISSPVVSVNGKFLKATSFGEDIEIYVTVKKFNGVKLEVKYEMKRGDETVFKGESCHCFVKGKKMKVVNLKKEMPNYYKRLVEFSGRQTD
ncbi:MAG: acyl-CoA thioesterase [Clostridia bacterium]|nr:acyl-CoA thioesterase [Clostridia bacterium]